MPEKLRRFYSASTPDREQIKVDETHARPGEQLALRFRFGSGGLSWQPIGVLGGDPVIHAVKDWASWVCLGLIGALAFFH